MAGPDRSISDIMAFSIELIVGDDENRPFDSERHGHYGNSNNTGRSTRLEVDFNGANDGFCKIT